LFHFTIYFLRLVVVRLEDFLDEVLLPDLEAAFLDAPALLPDFDVEFADLVACETLLLLFFEAELLELDFFLDAEAEFLLVVLLLARPAPEL
jgi:hypothetical protein